MANGDIYRLTVTFKSDLSPYVAQIGPCFRQDFITPVQPTAEEDLVLAWTSEVETGVLGCVTSSLRVVKYSVAKLPTVASIYADEPGASGPVGTLTGDRLPPRTASILSFRSATPGKRGRGRMYLPPAAESVNTDGGPTAGHVANVTNVGDLIVDGMGVADANHEVWTWVVWSEADQTARNVVSWVGRQYWGSQRDRTRIFASG